MNEKRKYLLKNTAILAISNFATKFLSFFFIPLYTGILTTSEYGIFDLVSSTINLLIPILTLNIVDAVMRFSMEAEYSNDDIGRIGIKYVIRSSLIASVILLLMRILGWLPEIYDYLPLVFLNYLCSCTLNFFIQYAKGCEQVKTMGIASVLTSVCTIAFNILFLLVFKIGLRGFFWATILSQLVTCIYYEVQLNFIQRIRRGKENKALEKKMLIYCIPLIATTLSWWINSALDKYVVTYLCGIAANGLLSISYKLPTVMQMLENIFSQAWQISAIKEYGNEDASVFYGKTFQFINTLMCIACAGLTIFNRPIAYLLFANEFYSAWQYVPFLLISTVLNCASGMLGPILVAKKDSKAMMRSAMVGTVANIVLNFLLVWAIGIQGAAVATALSSYAIYIVRKKTVGEDIKIEHYIIIPLTWGLLCAQAIVEITLSNYYIEGFIMLMVGLINYRCLFQVIEAVKNLWKEKYRRL